MSDDESSVRVAVRIRPQLSKEVLDMCRVCTTVTPGEPQVTLGADKSFTYDYVFDTEVDQLSVYESCSKSLVKGSLEGYNATILAYGQTGSGKTYTMGTGFEVDVNSELVGIIPRAINDLFDGIKRITDHANENGVPPPQFKITAQFLELYNEEIIDLFESAREYTKGKSSIRIHEDSNRSIYLTDVRSEKVSSPEEALQWLKQGSLARTTASTRMNAQSSRSHAIFTLHIRQQRVVSSENCEDEEGEGAPGDFETLSAKFHFVDLAGSERLKRTGATGDRAKEGISINCGLLALGNVISALGDQTKRALHVPYRDSKLTRLLQDSLGGNSRTLMIACVSPSDRDFMETLNTLNYANRARNIQNKVVINQDKSSRTISLLKKQIQELQLELLEYKQGKRVVSEDGVEAVNDMFHENTLLMTELECHRTRIKAMQQTIDSLNAKNIELLSDRTMAGFNQDGDNKNDDMSQMIKGYLTEIEHLRAKLMESESVCAELRKAAARNRRTMSNRANEVDSDVDNIIDLAKKEVEREMNMISSQRKDDQSDDSERDSESSDSDGEGDDSEENKNTEYTAELAVLNSEISIKQQLIDALEKNQKKLHNMKQHYEEKLVLLQEKIQATVKERDSVLASYGKGNNHPTEKVKKIKDDYEKRLSDMQREMKSLQSAKREHSKLLKNQSLNENQIRTLSNEVSEMKRTKVKLMNKMKEESQRHKEAETRRNREIAQLKKQNRMDANIIKKMEAEKRANTIVLKRKHEEVAALRTAVNRKPWMKSNGRAKDNQRQVKHKWVSLEKNIAESTINKQSIAALEREMTRKIESRAEIQEEIKQKTSLLSDQQLSDASSRMVREELENLQANLDHIQTSIRDLQNEILQVEENKVTFESGDVLNTIVHPSEASYILEKLYNMALHQSCLAAQNDSTARELQAENEQLKKDSEMQEQLLRHLLENREKRHARLSPNGNSSSTTSSRSTSPVDNGSIYNILRRENGKQRKKMMAPQDLLFQNESTGSMTCSYHSGHSHSAATSPEHHPAPGSILAPPPLTRSLTTIKEKGLDSSPPGSPPVYRRQTSREENVFSRLTSQLASSIPLSTSRRPGKITNYNFSKRGRARLQCTNVVEGHSKAVLALHATNDYLFTASKDRTVVVWDLHEMRESQVYGNFPNSVVAVKYDPQNHLLFSVSSCYIKVYDVRASKPIRTLKFTSSQGNSASWSSQPSNFESSNQTINAIAISENGASLYTAINERVRIWDLRKFSIVGKLLGGHQAAIMCLAVSQTDTAEDTVVTGSKDHYIKIFNVGVEPGMVVPRVTLEPPHYDGIQCLALRGEVLFSGSRDCHIKKWTLDSHDLVTSVNAAHRDWVTDLCFAPSGSVLVSGSRDGNIKLWSVDSCVNLAEVKAHDSPINALASNASHIFSASNDGKCMMWKMSPHLAV